MPTFIRKIYRIILLKSSFRLCCSAALFLVFAPPLTSANLPTTLKKVKNMSALGKSASVRIEPTVELIHCSHRTPTVYTNQTIHMLGYNRIREERSDDSAAEAEVTRSASTSRVRAWSLWPVDESDLPLKNSKNTI